MEKLALRPARGRGRVRRPSEATAERIATGTIVFSVFAPFSFWPRLNRKAHSTLFAELTRPASSHNASVSEVPSQRGTSLLTPFGCAPLFREPGSELQWRVQPLAMSPWAHSVHLSRARASVPPPTSPSTLVLSPSKHAGLGGPTKRQFLRQLRGYPDEASLDGSSARAISLEHSSANAILFVETVDGVHFPKIARHYHERSL